MPGAARHHAENGLALVDQSEHRLFEGQAYTTLARMSLAPEAGRRNPSSDGPRSLVRRSEE